MDDITGVVEEPYFAETIDLALRLFPGTTTVYVFLGGSAETAKVNLESLIFYLGLHRDREGATFSGARESLAFVKRHTDRPVFFMWSQHLPYCLGGVMISGKEQGALASRTALRILRGERAADIPLIRESPNRRMINYDELSRFGMGRDDLPDDSLLINFPASSFRNPSARKIWQSASSKSYWHLSRGYTTNAGMSNRWLEEQGLISIKSLWCKAQGYD